MDKLTIYLGKTILGAILLVILLLIGIEFIFSLMNELRYVGTGDYTTLQAIGFVSLLLPMHLAQLFPISALIGTLLGLGLLASRSELIVMQAAGLSHSDIIIAVLKLAVVLSVCVWLLGEGIAPLIDKYARTEKTLLLSKGQALSTLRGTWMRDGNDFIHIQAIYAGGYLKGITRYQFDQNKQLHKTSFAQFADYHKNHWILHDIEESIFEKNKIKQAIYKEKVWHSHIDPTILSIVDTKDLSELSLPELWQTIHYRQANALDTGPYRLAWWQKIARPFAVLVMMFLAIPFIFGSLRSATTGLRMVIGVSVGFVFYMINQLLGPLSLVYRIPPLVGAWLPIVLFFFIGLYLLNRSSRIPLRRTALNNPPLLNGSQKIP